MRRRGLRGRGDGLSWAVLAASRDLFLCLGVVLVGCDRAEAPAPTVAAAPVKAPVEAPAVAERPPMPSSLRMYTSSDGLVAAPRPEGSAWECLEQVASEPGQEATLIKCRHVDRGRFFFLMAKDYSVPASEVKTPDELANGVFPATYKKLFERHEVVESKAMMHAGFPAQEVRVEAVHASMGPIRKRERVMTAGNHVFILSAEGKPDVYDAEYPAIEAWFAGARFKNLTK